MASVKDLLFGYPSRDTNTNTGILIAIVDNYAGFGI